MCASALTLLVFAPPLIFPSLLAQQPASTSPLPAPGQVTGRVFCADTDQPGRFASIQLVGEHAESNPLLDPGTLGKNPNFEKAFAKAMTAVFKSNNLSTVTGLDGSFSLDKVPPGTYYVLAQLAGYQSPLSQFSMLERVKVDDATLKAVQNAAEKIVVQPNQAAHVEIRIERGASISGVIRYDDGSPAPGVAPALMVLGTDGKWKELSASGMLPTTTDDRGHYRIYGMAAGKYAIKATLPTMQGITGLGTSVSLHMNLGDALVVYSGGALREKDLKPLEVGPGDDVDGIDVIFPIDNLHTVSGSVVAKADQHPLDSGMVELDDSETKDKLRVANIEQDGSFHLNYVPEGQYLLRVTLAADTDTAGGADTGNELARILHTKILKSYGEADLPLTVKNDATGLVLQAPDLPATPAKTPAALPAPGTQ